MLHFIVNWLAGTPNFAAPYALAALGLIISERAGVLSLGAEGFMLVGALAGVATELELGGYPGVALVWLCWQPPWFRCCLRFWSSSFESIR